MTHCHPKGRYAYELKGSSSGAAPWTHFGLVGHSEAGDSRLTKMVVEEVARRIDGDGVTCTIIESLGQTAVTDGFLDAILLIDVSQIDSRVLPLRLIEFIITVCRSAVQHNHNRLAECKGRSSGDRQSDRPADNQRSGCEGRFSTPPKWPR